MGLEKREETQNVIERFVKLPHPKISEPGVLISALVTSALGAIIGMELIVRVGINPNTSIIGALIAVLIGLIPSRLFIGFRNIHRQNLIQTAISAATFVAGNVLLLSMGTIWLLGRPDMVIPMFIGAIIGCVIDISMMYWLFDTPAYPADAAWPEGIATSETILAAAVGGKRALLLLITGVVGAIGQAFSVPMDVIGITWIGNIWALLMFGIGLLIRAYSPVLFGIDINALYIPHGIMLGAGVVALVQITLIIRGKRLTDTKEDERTPYVPTRTSEEMIKALRNGFLLYLLGGLVLSTVCGLYDEMGVWILVWWIVWAAISALVSELMVGISAMHAGWFPGFATALIFLVLGMLMGFPPLSLGVLVGYTASTGPAFADMGYDLKTGWLLRGRGRDKEYELFGRRQQYFAEILGALVAVFMVAISYKAYFMQDLFPPVDRVFAATIEAGAEPWILKNLLIWGIVGAIIQYIGGAERQIGILFATGLLIFNPAAGFAAVVGITLRFIIERIYGEKAQTPMYITAAGFIAGSALYSFFSSTLSALKPRK